MTNIKNNKLELKGLYDFSQLKPDFIKLLTDQYQKRGLKLKFDKYTLTLIGNELVMPKQLSELLIDINDLRYPTTLTRSATPPTAILSKQEPAPPMSPRSEVAPQLDQENIEPNADLVEIEARLKQLVIDAPSSAIQTSVVLASPVRVGTFKNPLLRDAIIREVDGASGLFVAFKLNNVDAPRELDNLQLKRFLDLVDHPIKVGPKNRNGFKWFSNGKEPLLFGKITRSPYRFLPTFKEVNPQGQTVFFYGKIVDTKSGKKANRYL